MGFFSFGKKDDTPRRRGASARSARSGGTFEARDERPSRRRERAADADAMLLDPTLPEKQRARRRLVGAIALVLAAVVVLPMVLDSHPKPVTNDIAIDIPNRPATVPSRASDDNAEDAQAAVAPDRADMSGTTASGPATAGLAAAPAIGSSQSPSGAQGATKRAEPKQAESKQTQSKQTSTAPAASPPADAAQTAKPIAVPGPSAAKPDSGTPAAPPGSRFAVRLGVFADEATGRAWERKLKAAGVPAYIEHPKQADGKARTMLFAGPFADRAAASAAVAKVREAGLAAGTGSASQ